VRAELISEIKHQARLQLAEAGAPAISLRAITRSMGMASSAIYRYFPSRDDLLTALIVDAYDSLGAMAEAVADGCDPRNHRGRWWMEAHAIRDWARAHPNDYAWLPGPGADHRTGQPGDAGAGRHRGRRLGGRSHQGPR
jgi:AcrR family transcriptional regulator